MRNENRRIRLFESRKGEGCHLTLFAFSLFTFYLIDMPVPPELIDILRCPKCKSTVELKPDNSALKCTNAECSLVYPIKDDIPVMLVEEATVEK